MTTQSPSLAARALAQLVSGWPTYAHGEHLTGNFNLAGFNVLNHGNFSSVVEGLPGQVIKVFSLKDIGYQHLLEYAMSSKSEFLASTYSFTKSGNYGIVELERLDHRIKEAVSISQYIDKCKHNPKPIKHKWGDDFRDLILKINHSIKSFNASNNNSLSWDCHEDNIMFRGSTPVLVDVLYGER